LLGEDDSWRDTWDGAVGQKIVFSPPPLAF
jgi:hypothetical protein